MTSDLFSHGRTTELPDHPCSLLSKSRQRNRQGGRLTADSPAASTFLIVCFCNHSILILLSHLYLFLPSPFVLFITLSLSLLIYLYLLLSYMQEITEEDGSKCLFYNIISSLPEHVVRATSQVKAHRACVLAEWISHLPPQISFGLWNIFCLFLLPGFHSFIIALISKILINQILSTNNL